MNILEITVKTPLITEIIKENHNKFDVTFQHYIRQISNYLDNNFSIRWIDRRARMEWPACTPDLTPLDFFHETI